MEATDPYSHQGIEEQSAEQGGKLDISQVPPAQIEPQDGHWLRMDPSLTRAVLAKTEEELLGSLAALMRNKVEHEQVCRRSAQIQIETEQAKHDLEAIKGQIRRAEEEVATRLNEHSRINEESVRVRQELAILHDTHREVIAQLTQIQNEKTAREEALMPLREEVEERITAREALIAETVALHQHVSDLAGHKEQHTADMERLKSELTDLRSEIAAAAAERQRLQQELSEAAEKAEQARLAEGLPLLFGAEAQKIAPEWDSYPLESEFHTDEELDAKKVAELVAKLPGLEGCLIVKNHGPVLASRMPERLHAHLKVPDRDYQLLFERPEKKLDEYLQNAHLATFDLGAEALTVAQAKQVFVFVNHRQSKLRPGVPDKLAAIVSEVAKMYP
jgi:hypothetical protein